MFYLRAAAAVFICGFVATVPAVATAASVPLPLKQNGGTWDSGHVQGIAVDVKGGYIYYSFTNLLAKYDFSGKLLGTLVGWTGHLGDLDFNAADGKLYGSLEYGNDQAFYIAVIDVSRLDRVGIEVGETEIFRTVYLPEVTKDFVADMDGDGRPEGNSDGKADDRAAGKSDGKVDGTAVGKSDGKADGKLGRRYGCSGIDGVGFGPAFGHVDGPRYLTVAYGVYGDTAREDNDHQVLLQYDVSDWSKYAKPLNEAEPHHSGPDALQGKYFVHTGNTTWGVQNLSYDDSLQRWFMGVYQGKKQSFPNYLLFAVDARTQPKVGDLVGVRSADGKGWEQAPLLALADDGLKDEATGVRGWNQKGDVGFQPVGRGLFYLSVNSGGKGAQTSDLTLMRWTGDANRPFAPATAGDVR